ncbi:MAG: hypothetical protein IT359_16200 [Gemmatimonadaceae bacterium]|nr:hypothetical protein [Gemmatimonadaceae bacterium]
MTPQPATPDTALQVPATPVTPLSNAATGTNNQVLATGATSPKKRKGGRVLVTQPSLSSVAEVLFEQTQGVPPDEVVYVESAEQFRDRLAEYSSIDHLAILLHMIEDELLFAQKQRTLAETQVVIEGSVPPIARWTFDGCGIGRGTSALYAFAEHFGVARMEGWTHYHHLESWGKVVSGVPSAATIAAQHTELERAANFLPKGDAGATYSASEMESLMQQGTSFTYLSEFFTYYGEDSLVFANVLTDPRWTDSITGQPVLQPWAAVRHPTEAWYPRTAAVTRVVSSPQEASAFELYFDSNPQLYRVVIMPPAKVP